MIAADELVDSLAVTFAVCVSSVVDVARASERP